MSETIGFATKKLSPKELAELLGVRVFTLQEWRKKRKGPPYHREVGRIFYYHDEVMAWWDSTRWR